VHFDGANFSSEVWVNGTQVGTIQGAFIRGRFDMYRRSRIPAFPTSTPSRTASAKTAASRPSTGRPSSHHRLGLACRRFATATPASGKRCGSPLQGPCVEDALVITDLPLPKHRLR
jgi:hypothetical protein